MLLDGSNLDLGHIEAEIRRSLAGAGELGAAVDNACGRFEIILAKVLGLVAGNRKWRYWSLDDVCCQSFTRTGDEVSLEGLAFWLSGGEGCDRFRLDVALDTEPLLYSYKFSNSNSGEQLLYVGKTPDGWVVNGA